MTVDEVCKLHAIDTNFFLQLANTVHDKEYFPMEEFLNFPVEWVVNYLKKTHRYHVVFKIPEIEQQIAHLERKSSTTLLTRSGWTAVRFCIGTLSRGYICCPSWISSRNWTRR